MYGLHPANVTTGLYVKARGHRVHDLDYLMWWKVTGTDGDTITAVNRHGKTTRWNIPQMRRLNWKFVVWEPGDPRTDEVPDSLPR